MEPMKATLVDSMPTEDWIYCAFDLLRLNGEDLRGLPIEERKAKLAALLRNPPPGIRYSPSFTEKIDEFLTRVRALSLEGLIGKRPGCKNELSRQVSSTATIVVSGILNATMQLAMSFARKSETHGLGRQSRNGNWTILNQPVRRNGRHDRRHGG